MAVLAAYAGRKAELADVAEYSDALAPRVSLNEVAAQMVRIRQVIEPRPRHTEQFMTPDRKLLDELERRGWLSAAVAAFARKQV
jgi:hypothetical protein